MATSFLALLLPSPLLQVQKAFLVAPGAAWWFSSLTISSSLIPLFSCWATSAVLPAVCCIPEMCIEGTLDAQSPSPMCHPFAASNCTLNGLREPERLVCPVTLPTPHTHTWLKSDFCPIAGSRFLQHCTGFSNSAGEVASLSTIHPSLIDSCVASEHHMFFLARWCPLASITPPRAEFHAVLGFSGSGPWSEPRWLGAGAGSIFW